VGFAGRQVRPVLRVERAAQLLRSSRTSAYALANQWLATGGPEGLPAERIGRSIRIPTTAIERLAALDIYDDHIRDWTERDLSTARVLADIATGYLMHASELDRARRVNEQLQAALDSRVVIEQAKGLLAGERGISLDTAFAVLRNHARNRNAPIHAIAQAVVELGLRP
jgi:hypothetical protein